MAGPDGKIEVELTLITANAIKAASVAAANMQKAFRDASPFSQSSKQASDIDKVTAAENKATSAVKEHTKATKALTDQQQRLKNVVSPAIFAGRSMINPSKFSQTFKNLNPGLFNPAAQPAGGSIPNLQGMQGYGMASLSKNKFQLPSAQFPLLPNVSPPAPSGFAKLAPLI